MALGLGGQPADGPMPDRICTSAWLGKPCFSARGTTKNNRGQAGIGAKVSVEVLIDTLQTKLLIPMPPFVAYLHPEQRAYRVQEGPQFARVHLIHGKVIQ
eukprot:9476380-Pyramimonas_sp.AAC.1